MSRRRRHPDPTSREPAHRAAPPAATSVAPPSGLGSLLVGVFFAALNLALASPVSGPKDAAEFTLALALNGVPHPTGYPLYVLIGHPFALVLHGLGASWAYAANAWSAVGGGVAAGLLHALAVRIVPPRLAAGRLARFLLALVATALLALNPVWLLDATLAEVYTWHMAWAAGASLFALTVFRRDPREVSAAWTTGTAAGWGLLGGIGLAHHVTAVLVLVPLSAGLALALVRLRAWRPSLLIVAGAAALLPLSAYLFVAWRAFHPAAWQWPLLAPSWAGVLAHVRGAEYGDLIGRFAPDEVQAGLLRAYAWPVLFPALALSLWAALSAPAGERALRWSFTAAAFLQTLYAFNYGVRDPSCYFQPAMALALLAIPEVGAPLAARRRGTPGTLATGLTALALVALAAGWLPMAWSVRQGTIDVDRRLRAMWSAIPPGPGFVLWAHDMAETFAVYQRLEGRRPELFAGNPMTLSWAGPRRAFERRFGFDPLAGMDPLTSARAPFIPENIGRQTRLPVYRFDFDRGRVERVARP